MCFFLWGCALKENASVFAHSSGLIDWKRDNVAGSVYVTTKLSCSVVIEQGIFERTGLCECAEQPTYEEVLCLRMIEMWQELRRKKEFFSCSRSITYDICLAKTLSTPRVRMNSCSWGNVSKFFIIKNQFSSWFFICKSDLDLEWPLILDHFLGVRYWKNSSYTTVNFVRKMSFLLLTVYKNMAA